jgi:hypothetical protein
VDQDVDTALLQSGLRSGLRRKDVLDGLDFAEMVAATDAAERRVKCGAVETSVSRDAVDVAIPGLIERAEPVGQLVEPELARCDIELKQSHAAADVGADQLRVKGVHL